jgi:hypothetical protein
MLAGHMSTATTYSIPPTGLRASRRRRRQRAVVLLALATLYVGCYVILSISGGYTMVASGELRMFPPGLSMDDEFAWEPRWGFAHRRMLIDGTYFTACDLPGFFYMPLIRLDQKLVHATLRVITSDFKFHEDIAARATPLHPRERDRPRL